MLIRITNKCLADCSHCVHDSNPEGEHMSISTFDKVRYFVSQTKPKVVLLSGGEPTLHPGLRSIVHYLMKETAHIVVLSNGSFINDKELTQTIFQLMRTKKVSVQVRTHPLFYKFKLSNKMKQDLRHMGCEIFDDGINTLIKQGRASLNHADYPQSTCSCINPILVAKQRGNWSAWLSAMENVGRYCSPHITPQGEVLIGEGQCSSIGTVEDSIEHLFNRISNYAPSTCNVCGAYEHTIKKHPQIQVFGL